MSIGRLILADDLSGATDSAACFAGDGDGVRTYFDVGRVHPGAAVALDLGTRDRTSGDFRAALRSAEHLIAAAALTFKKVDSLLRGHWAEEVSYLMDCGRFERCIFAPALPHHGRVTIGGRQRLRRADGCLEEISGDLRDTLRAAGSGATHIASRITVCDATTERDLDAIVAWGMSMPHKILWCGSAGLAQSLALGKPPPWSPVRAPLLAIYGTNHPASVGQLEYAGNHGFRLRIVTDESGTAQASVISEDLRRFGHCILSFGLPESLPATASHIMAMRLSELLPLIQKPDGVIVTGGETLYSVCVAAATDHIEVRAQLALGIPQSVLRGGAWDAVTLVSKSGGFGRMDWLAELLGQAPGVRRVGEGLS